MTKTKVSLTITQKLMEEVESLIDGIKIKNRSDAVEHLLRLSLSNNKHAVILLGGPKENNYIDRLSTYRPLVKIKNKYVIEYELEELKKNGFRNIIIIAESDLLAEIFRVIGNGELFGANIKYIIDKDSKGTFESLKKAKNHLNTSFLVIYGDIIFTTDLKKLWDYHLKNNALMTITLTSSDNPKEKGAVYIEGEKVTAFSQKSSKIESNIVFSPIILCNQEILEFSGESIEKDIIPILIEKNKVSGYLTATKEFHIHNTTDMKKAEEQISDNYTKY